MFVCRAKKLTIIDNKEINLICCNTFFTRLRGCMFTKNINYALMFKNCNSIHTCISMVNKKDI